MNYYHYFYLQYKLESQVFYLYCQCDFRYVILGKNLINLNAILIYNPHKDS